MHAIAIDAFKSPGALRDLPDPKPAPDCVLVRVTFAGVNPVDWKVRDGDVGERAFPLVLGQDFAGVVEHAGERITRLVAGDRIFGSARDRGSYATLTSIRDNQHDSPFERIPDGVSDQQAAALPTPGLTALASLETLAVRSGTRVLIVGAGGAVGKIAVQIAHNRGAHVAAVVLPNQIERARANGADDAIEAADDLVAALQSVRERPFEAMLDLVSDSDALQRNAALLAEGAKLVTTVHVADAAWFSERGIDATNLVVYQTAQSTPEALRDLARMVADGTLDVDVDMERPLAEAPKVLDWGKAGKLEGKAVLRV